MRTVSFTTESYLPLLDAWHRISADALPRLTDIVCADDVSFQRASARAGLRAHRLTTDIAGHGFHRRRRGFWLARFDALREFLDDDDLIHTDLDAFWLRDPVPRLADIDADLVFSIEYGLPKDIVDRWGFVLCCGFFAARSTPTTKAFFDRWRAAVAEHEDDQKAINYLLAEMGVAWEEPTAGGDVLRLGTVHVDGKLMRVAALRESAVRRSAPIDLAAGQLVFHPFFDKVTLAGSFQIYAHLATGPLPALTESDVDAMCARYGVHGLKGRNRADLCLLDHLISGGADHPDLLAQQGWILNTGGAPAAALDVVEPVFRGGDPGDSAMTVAAVVVCDAASHLGSSDLATEAARFLARHGDAGQLWRRRIFDLLLEQRHFAAAARYGTRAAWQHARSELGR
ncbi:MAG: putative nucleotide-diphospho-sugar transferase [Acidimicrobiales bacterium]